MSEAINAVFVPVAAISITAVSSANVATARTIATIALNQNNPSRVLPALAGPVPVSTVNLRVSYTDPAGNQATAVIQDLAGRDLVCFSNRFADTFVTSAITTLASTYQNLTLTGATAIIGTGNALNHVLYDDTAANSLNDGAGNDSLTGGAETIRSMVEPVIPPSSVALAPPASAWIRHSMPAPMSIA